MPFLELESVWMQVGRANELAIPDSNLLESVRPFETVRGLIQRCYY